MRAKYGVPLEEALEETRSVLRAARGLSPRDRDHIRDGWQAGHDHLAARLKEMVLFFHDLRLRTGNR